MIKSQDMFMGQNIFVGNLAKSVSEQMLTQLFTCFGQVLSTTVVRDRDTGESRGFGFVEMSSESEAANAIATMNGKLLNHHPLRMNLARPKEVDGESIHWRMRLHRRHRY